MAEHFLPEEFLKVWAIRYEDLRPLVTDEELLEAFFREESGCLLWLLKRQFPLTYSLLEHNLPAMLILGKLAKDANSETLAAFMEADNG